VVGVLIEVPVMLMLVKICLRPRTGSDRPPNCGRGLVLIGMEPDEDILTAPVKAPGIRASLIHFSPWTARLCFGTLKQGYAQCGIEIEESLIVTGHALA